MSTSPIARAARATTAPVRNFFNDHFEMVKDEVRRNARTTGSGGGGGDAKSWQRVAELENNLAEQSLYQARVLNRLSDDVADLAGRIEDLERVVRQLAEVAAARPGAN